MPVSGAVRRAVADLLPGEKIAYVFPATVPMSMSAYVVIAVSDKAITVFTTGYRSWTMPKSVLARYPRTTALGPVELSGGPNFWLDGVSYEVDEEYVSVVNAADAEISLVDLMPPDPLSDL